MSRRETMQQSCSVFCRDNDQPEVLNLVKHMFGDSAALKSIRNGVRIQINGGSLTLNFLVFRRRADKFSTTRGSTYFYFARANSSDTEVKKAALEDLLKCNLIIGVLAKPELEHDQRFVDLVYRIAINLNGYIFDGTHLVDSTGNVLLPS